MAKTNKTKPVEEIPCEFCKGIGFHGEFCPHRIKDNWELEFDAKYPKFQKLYTWEKKEILDLLSHQAEHFVEMGEGLKRKSVKTQNGIVSTYTRKIGYNQGVSDFQEAIKNEK